MGVWSLTALLKTLPLALLFMATQVFLCGDALADAFYDLKIGYSSGTFTTDKSFPIAGGLAGMEGGFYWHATPGLNLAVGGEARYSALSHTPDGIKKPANFYQMGPSASILLFLGNTFHVQLHGNFWNYSKLYVFSDVKSSVNGEEYRNQSFVLYDGGSGFEGSLGFFSEAKRKGRSSVVRYGLVVGYESQSFTSKSERVVITRPGADKNDATVITAETNSLVLANALLSLGLVF